jgi:hypothetical protein
MCHVLVFLGFPPSCLYLAGVGFHKISGGLESNWCEGWSDYILEAFLNFGDFLESQKNGEWFYV